jgi:hypothetical protein
MSSPINNTDDFIALIFITFLFLLCSYITNMHDAFFASRGINTTLSGYKYDTFRGQLRQVEWQEKIIRPWHKVVVYGTRCILQFS